jgi:hypothetical protein
MLRSLVVAALLAVAAPATAHAAAAVEVETATEGQTLSDGDRFAAWTHDGAVRVLDETTQATASFPLPAGCHAPAAIGDGRLAADCGEQLDLLDIASATWSAVPATRALRSVLDADSFGIDAVGRVWIAVTVATGYHGPVYPAWIERATGRVVTDDLGDVNTHADLDAPGLWAPLCAPLHRRRDPDYDPLEPYGSPFLEPTMAGRRGIDVAHSGALVMRRCGTRKARVITRSRTWGRAWIGASRVSWIDQRGIPALEGDPRGHGRVRTYDAVTGRVRSWPVPGAVNPNLHVVHTRRHVFIDKRSTGLTARRYAIDLAG